MNDTSILQPHPAPEPGRPFVDRDGELELIADKLRRGCRGDPMPLAVVCFWGASGIGKSWLLGELARQHRRCESTTQDSCPTLAARLDMSRQSISTLWQGRELDVRRVIQELWKQLAQQLGTAVPELERLSPDEYAGRFVEHVTDWLEYATPILMIDTADVLMRDDETAFFWLEEHLVEPLALTDRVLFVIASRGELRRWRRWQVRRRVDPYPLSAFDADTAGQEVRANDEVSAALYRHTYGHPLATEYLGRLLEWTGIDLSTATGDEASAALGPAVVQTALDRAVERLFVHLPAEKRPGMARLARHTSVLRWVNVGPLRSLLEALGVDDLGRGDGYYLDLITDLQAHHLLYWDISSASYTTDPALRRLLAHALEIGEPEQFCQAHQASYRYHRDHLDRFPQYLAHYLPEAAFHYAVVAQGGARPQDELDFWTWWDRFLSGPAPADAGTWRELADVLEKDGELREVLSAEEHGRLCSAVHERAALGTKAR
jgi:hypothetical protein